MYGPHQSLAAVALSGILLLAVLATPVILACWREIRASIVEIYDELYGRVG